MRISDWRSDVCSSDLQAPGDERTGRVDVEGVEPEQRGARQQRRVHLEEGVLGGRADEGDEAALDDGEQGVMLRLAEAVHLVEEQDRALAPLPPIGRESSRERV